MAFRVGRRDSRDDDTIPEKEDLAFANGDGLLFYFSFEKRKKASILRPGKG